MLCFPRLGLGSLPDQEDVISINAEDSQEVPSEIDVLDFMRPICPDEVPSPVQIFFWGDMRQIWARAGLNLDIFWTIRPKFSTNLGGTWRNKIATVEGLAHTEL